MRKKKASVFFIAETEYNTQKLDRGCVAPQWQADKACSIAET